MTQAKATSSVFMAFAALLLAAAPARAQEYNYNRVLQLDGSGDFVEVPSPPAVGPAMTVEAWIKTSVTTGDQVIISRYKANSGSNLDDSYLLSVHNGRARFQINPGNTFVILDGNTFIADGRWHHVVGTYSSVRTYDVSSGHLDLWIDGSLDNRRVGVSGSLNNPTGTNVRIGAMFSGSSGVGFFFNGQIDEVRLWNKYYRDGAFLDPSIPLRNSTEAYPLLAAWRFNGHPDTGLNASFMGNAVEVASLDVPLSYDSHLALNFGSHLTIQSGSSLTPSSGLTIEAWVKSISSGGTLQSVVSKYRHNSNSNTDDAYFLGIEPSGVARFQISIGSNFHLLRGSTNLFSGDACIQDPGQWHHLAGVFDGSELKLFVDGRLEARGPLSGSISSNSTPLLIGASQEGTTGVVSDFFVGYLDNVQIWNIALTEFDILCDAGSSNTNCRWRIFPPGSLVAEWRFEGDFINLVNYRSGFPRFWGTPVGNVRFCTTGTCLGPSCK